MTEQVRGTEVRRNAVLCAGLGVAAAVLAIGWLQRAAGSGRFLDWLLCLLMTLIAVVQLSALVDGRTPLVVADAQGARIRLGGEWLGLPWSTLEQVVVEQRDTPVRDGRSAPASTTTWSTGCASSPPGAPRSSSTAAASAPGWPPTRWRRCVSSLRSSSRARSSRFGTSRTCSGRICTCRISWLPRRRPHRWRRCALPAASPAPR
jgi:hypothetical protein